MGNAPCRQRRIQSLNIDESDWFSVPQLLQMRREVLEKGVVADEFLPDDADSPVFGFNVACAYPFPESVTQPYKELASKLSGLGPAVYVYPLWETHVTIMTFVNFSRHKRPSSGSVEALRSLVAPVTEILQCVLESASIKSFTLQFHAPVLSRKAAVLPVLNPTGEIQKLRRLVTDALKAEKKLYEKLQNAGLTTPGIIHSTILRFKRAPDNLFAFLGGFDGIAFQTKPFTVRIRELLLTAETKPYMRGGEVLRRFSLGESDHA